MRYSTLTSKQANKIWDAYCNHHMYINKKYQTFCNSPEDNEFVTDRVRFVNKFFSRFVGKYVILMDRIKYGTKFTDRERKYVSIACCDANSIYAMKNGFEGHEWGCEDLIHFRRVYLHIVGFESVNTEYGQGYIAVYCDNIYGERIKYRMEYNMLYRMQWREITEMEYTVLSAFFTDDRENVRYTSNRYLMYDEMVQRKIIRKNAAKNIPTIKEPVEVYARDRDDAVSMIMKVYGDKTIICDAVEQVDL